MPTPAPAITPTRSAAPSACRAPVRVLFTLDYEIHGNGDGCPHKLIVEPTARMLRQFDLFGARLTILADAGEILRFKQHLEQTGRDDFHYHTIAEQLRTAIATGHDVQLHIHSGYFNARHDGHRWVQDWSEYNFAGLPLERMTEMVRAGKDWLETLLRPVRADYACNVFRAANWSVHPSANVIRALVNNGIHIDTSVFKYGVRNGLVTFDYSDAPSEALPWRAHPTDVCTRDPKGPIAEFPIYTENRWIGAFLTSHRIHRAILSRRHKVQRDDTPGSSSQPPKTSLMQRGSGIVRRLLQKHAWKADFNQCTGAQLVQALQRCEQRHRGASAEVPFVLIGHSKLFTPGNERSLTTFLRFVSDHPDRFAFAVFGDCRLPDGLTPATL